MGSFVFSNHDVMIISISINACFLIQMVTTRLVRWLLPFLSLRSSMGRNLFIVHQRWPDLLGRVLSEQTTLLIILILILVNLGFVSSPILPFREHKNSEYHQLTRVVLSASTARFLLIALNVLFANDVIPSAANNDIDFSRINIRGSSGHTKSAGWHFIYCVFSIASNVIGLGYKQNLLLLGTSSFMELNTTSLVICRLIKLADRHRGCQSYFKMSILCCAVCLFTRVILPGLFLCLALGQETPFVMDIIPMSWFFICACVYFLYHIVLVYHSIKRISKASTFSSQSTVHSCHHHGFGGNGPFSIYSYSDRLTNDIYGEALLDSEKQYFDESCSSKPTTKLKDLNYGFLPCYDNRNLCSSVFEAEEEKINFLQKKNSSKHEFVYKFMPKENAIKNNDESSCAYYSRGFKAGSLTKERRSAGELFVETSPLIKGCRNTPEMLVEADSCAKESRDAGERLAPSEDLNESLYNCSSDEVNSDLNNLRGRDESGNELKFPKENLGYRKNIEIDNMTIELEEDKGLAFNKFETPQNSVKSIVTRCHSLPSPDFGEFAISEKDITDPSGDIPENQLVPRWISNESVYSNPLSFNKSVTLNRGNHCQQDTLEFRSDSCVAHLVKHQRHATTTKDIYNAHQPSSCVGEDCSYSASRSCTSCHNDLDCCETSPS